MSRYSILRVDEHTAARRIAGRGIIAGNWHAATGALIADALDSLITPDSTASRVTRAWLDSDAPEGVGSITAPVIGWNADAEPLTYHHDEPFIEPDHSAGAGEAMMVWSPLYCLNGEPMTETRVRAMLREQLLDTLRVLDAAAKAVTK